MVTNHFEGEDSYADELRKASDLLDSGASAQALQLFVELAARGSAMALVNVGWMYQTGSGVALDKSKARECFEEAASKGSVIANHYLGMLLYSAGDYEMALVRFRRSAEQLYAPSSYWASRMYTRGEGTAVDLRVGEQLLKAAASGGHLFAARDLAIAKISGQFGRRQIAVGAFEWARAVIRGLSESVQNPDSERLM